MAEKDDKVGLQGVPRLKRLSDSQKRMQNEEWRRAITSDSMSDFLLKNLLERTFSKQSKKVSDLFKCSMLQKAKFAYVLGFIDKATLDDLKLVKDIRNMFGHSWHRSFADPKVQKKCKRFSSVKSHKVKVTAKNSFKIYKETVKKCQKNIISAAFSQKESQKTTK